MPKQKTHSGTAKRFKVSASGKFKRGHNFKRHNLTKKSGKRRRNLRKATMASAAEVKMLNKLLPYQ